jgi:hypothetical protein
LHENYIVSFSPESFELLINFWQVSWLSRLLFHLLIRRLADNGIAEQKLIPISFGTGLQLRGQLRNRFIRTGIPF